MEIFIAPAKSIKRRLRVPGDKSITHRALMLATMADGESTITGFCPCADCYSTLACLQLMGLRASLRNGQETMRLSGMGMRNFDEPDCILPAGNSGTTIRLLSGILAGQNIFAVMNGDQSLNRRPMLRVIEPLRHMGALIFGRENGALPPIAIQGRKLTGIEYHTPVPSAQVKSAILFAGLYAKGTTVVVETSASRDHTENLFSYLEIPMIRIGHRVEVEGDIDGFPGFNLEIPGDISSAAYFIAAGAMTPDSRIEIEKVGLNHTRTGFLDVLVRMGADITITPSDEEGPEPSGNIIIRTSKLHGIDIEGEQVPRLIDELPLLAVVATQAYGVTRVTGAGELRFKETDRIFAIAECLSELGVTVNVLDDGFEIEGPVSIKGGRVRSYGDHRIAMSMAVAGMISKDGVMLEDAECVEISFPGFWEILGGACGL